MKAMVQYSLAEYYLYYPQLSQIPWEVLLLQLLT